MGGIASMRSESKEDRQRQLRRGVQELAGEYPDFSFGVIAEGEAGIEAKPRPSYEGHLTLVIRPDADGIRAALDKDAALKPGGT